MTQPLIWIPFVWEIKKKRTTTIPALPQVTRYRPNRPATDIQGNGRGLRVHYSLQNSLGGQIWPQIWNLWPKLHMLPCLFEQFRPVLALLLNLERRRRKKNSSLLDLSWIGDSWFWLSSGKLQPVLTIREILTCPKVSANFVFSLHIFLFPSSLY